AAIENEVARVPGRGAVVDQQTVKLIAGILSDGRVIDRQSAVGKNAVGVKNRAAVKNHGLADGDDVGAVQGSIQCQVGQCGRAARIKTGRGIDGQGIGNDQAIE